MAKKLVANRRDFLVLDAHCQELNHVLNGSLGNRFGDSLGDGVVQTFCDRAHVLHVVGRVPFSPSSRRKVV